jgi:hypothetical protein
MKRCNWCKREKPFSAYAEHKGRLMATCEECRPKKNAVNIKYAHGSTGTKTRGEYWSGSPGKAVRKKYNSGEGCKKSQKKWADSEKGAAYRIVKNERLAHKTATNPGFNLNLRLVASFNLILKGQKTCIHLKKTSFTSCSDVRKHFEGLLEGSGMTISDHGPTWWVGHRIPRVYFDHTNPADVKACWSKANMFPQLKESNHADSYFITKENCLAVGAANFPASWNQTMPSESEIAALHSKAHAGELWV